LVRQLIGAVLTIVLVVAFINLYPRLVSSLLLPEAAGGPYTRADAEQCHTASAELAGYPGEGADVARHVGLGLDGDLQTARTQAAAASAAFAGKARQLTAPASRAKLDDVAAELDKAAAAFAQPMTQTAYRAEYRRVGGVIEAFAGYCQSIDRWIKNNLRE